MTRARWSALRVRVIEAHGSRCATCGRPYGPFDVVRRDGAWTVMCRADRLRFDAPTRIAKGLRTRRAMRGQGRLFVEGAAA